MIFDIVYRVMIIVIWSILFSGGLIGAGILVRDRFRSK